MNYSEVQVSRHWGWLLLLIPIMHVVIPLVFKGVEDKPWYLILLAIDFPVIFVFVYQNFSKVNFAVNRFRAKLVNESVTWSLNCEITSKYNFEELVNYLVIDLEKNQILKTDDHIAINMNSGKTCHLFKVHYPNHSPIDEDYDDEQEFFSLKFISSPTPMREVKTQVDEICEMLTKISDGELQKYSLKLFSERGNFYNSIFLKDLLAKNPSTKITIRYNDTEFTEKAFIEYNNSNFIITTDTIGGIGMFVRKYF